MIILTVVIGSYMSQIILRLAVVGRRTLRGVGGRDGAGVAMTSQ